MPAKILIREKEAVIDQYTWTVSDPVIERWLNTFIPRGGASPSEPDPDLTVALIVADTVMAKLLSSEAVKLGSADSGFRGHKGRPGRRGGSAPRGLSVSLMNVPEGIYSANGWRSPSSEEQQKFVSSLQDLPKEIQDLWQEEHGLALAIEPNEDLFGLHMTNWIVVGTRSFEGPVARHEFIHHIVDQPSIRKNLRRYNPIQQFNHASRSPGGWERQQNEDLTMMLNHYSSNRNTWVSNLLGLQGALLKGGKLLTQEIAEAKVDSTISFMQEIGKWN